MTQFQPGMIQLGLKFRSHDCVERTRATELETGSVDRDEVFYIGQAC